MSFRFFVLFILSWPVAAGELHLVFRESHFLNQYRHEFYINEAKYIYIDDHFKLNDEGKWVPKIPALKIKTLNSDDQTNLINQLVELGVGKWKSEYPASGVSLICDGLSFTLYVKSHTLNMYSSGGCDFPPNYEKVRQILEDL